MVIALVATALANTARAERAASGQVVDDATGVGLAAATVVIGDAQAETDADGRFVIDTLPLGRLEVIVVAEGYAPYFGSARIGDTLAIRLSADAARRIALAAQGFARARPARPGPAALRGMFDRVQLVQLDSVNVLVRSHELPLWARLGDHARDLLPRAVGRRELFEYWGHEASLCPVALQPLLRWRMAAAGVPCAMGVFSNPIRRFVSSSAARMSSSQADKGARIRSLRASAGWRNVVRNRSSMARGWALRAATYSRRRSSRREMAPPTARVMRLISRRPCSSVTSATSGPATSARRSRARDNISGVKRSASVSRSTVSRL